MDLAPAELEVIDKHLFADQMIVAIRELRRFTDADLAEAKSFIDNRLQFLHAEYSDRFPKKPETPELDPTMMAQIQLLPDRDLDALRSTMEKIEKTLYGLNYQVTLAVGAVTVPTSELPVAAVMRTLYPESTPHETRVEAVGPDQLVTNVTRCLTNEGDTGAGPQFTPMRRKLLKDNLIPEYWRQLNALSPLETSTSVSYHSDTGLPGYFAFWFFVYLIHDAEKSRCVVITGMASD